jgi:hypothetical protein
MVNLWDWPSRRSTERPRARLLPMRSAQQIVYRYNGDASTDEVEFDQDGDQEVPQKDSIITRKQGRWKVVHVIVEETVSVPKAVPVHRVFLTDQF